MKRFAPLLASALGAVRDGGLSALLFLTVMLMILPMPTIIVDGLIGFNFAIALLLLMTAIYLPTPLGLSSLPGIILISTIFRLALSVTTTRLILSEGDAGAIIETFGAFVISGNLVVGLVVFFIVTIVQFMVVAKGAERIAEVGARFTLDAMPGKQMAIDAELRNGDLTADEARARRKALGQESQFYGAMDGAMKFVKGDSIAGLIIIAVNLVGGISIGVMQLGMSAGDAAAKYGLLSIGDALISQIPALLVALSAGTIVTRVQGDERENLGSDIIRQLGAEPKAVVLSGIGLLLLAIIPGFPILVLGPGGLALLLSGLALMRKARRRKAQEDAEAAEAEAEAEAEAAAAEAASAEADSAAMADATPATAAPAEMADAPTLPVSGAIQITAHPALAKALRGPGFAPGLKKLPGLLQADLGMDIPAIAVADDPDLPAHIYKLALRGEPILTDMLHLDHVVVAEDMHFLAALDIPADSIIALKSERESCAVPSRHAAELTTVDIVSIPIETWGLTRIETALRRHAALFIGLEEAKAYLEDALKDGETLANQATQNLNLVQFTDILRRLLRDGLSLKNRRALLEAMAEWANGDRTPEEIAEFIRLSCRRQICDQVANENGLIPALILDDHSEMSLRKTLEGGVLGPHLAVDPEMANRLLSQLRDSIDRSEGATLVVATSVELRRHLRRWLASYDLGINVMSYPEVADGYALSVVDTLRVA